MRARTLGLPTALVTALLAGCGSGSGSPAPTATPTPTVTTTPSPAPTLAPSPSPSDPAFTIATGAAADSSIAVGSDGSGWLAVYGIASTGPQPALVATRLAPDGAVLDDPAILVSDPSRVPASAFNPETASYVGPSIAFGGDLYSIVFFGSGGQGDAGEDLPFGQAILAATLTAEGGLGPVSALADNVTIGTPQPALFAPPAAAALGDTLLALWPSGAGNPQFCPGGGSPCLLFLSSNFGLSVGPGAPDIVVPTSVGAIAAGPLAALAAWGELSPTSEPTAREPRIRGALVRTGPQVQTLALATTPSAATTTAVAAGAEEFLVVWSAPSSGQADTSDELRGRIVRTDTGPIGPEDGFLITGASDRKALGGAAFASGTYLVTWTSGGGALAARVGPSGDVGPAFTLVESDALAAAVAANADGFLVAVLRQAGDAAEVLGIFVAPVPPDPA